MTTRRAAIDVGTNSVKLLVADVDGGEIAGIITDKQVTTGLGEGVSATGRLDPRAIERTAGQVARFAAAAAEQGAGEIRIGGTAALRNTQGTNADEFCDLVQAGCGLVLRVLDTQQELELARVATLREFGESSPLVVVDIGGGSTEVTVVIDGEVRESRSIGIGARRLTEQLGLVHPVPLQKMDESAALISEVFSLSDDIELEKDILFTTRTKLVVQGGTAYCVARICTGLPVSRLHGSVVSSGSFGRLVTSFMQSELSEVREQMPFDPDRAEVIMAGMFLLDRIMVAVGVRSFTFSNYSLRHGMVLAERW